MAAPLLAALGLPVLGLAGGAMSMFGGAMSLGGGMLHAGSTAIGLGAKGIGAIGKAAGGLLPGGGGGTDREIQGGQPDINGKYFNEKSNRWHDRNKNNAFTSAPAQFGAQGMAGGSGLAGGAGGGTQGELFSAEETHSEKPQEEVGAFGMLVGLLAGMANDIAIIRDLTTGILNSMIGEAQKDAQMELQEFAERQEAQRGQDELKDDIQREGSLTDTGEGDGKDGKTPPGVLSKLFGAGKTGMGKLLNQPNWIKAIGLGGLLWWLSNNKEGFITGLTGVLQFIKDTVDDFSELGFKGGSVKLFERVGEGISNLFTAIKESDTFKNLIDEVLPKLKDMVTVFTENMFAMIWDITKTALFGAKDSAGVREQGGEGLKHQKQILQVQAALGKGPLTEEIVKDAPKAQKDQIEQYTDDLWENMQEITEQSDWRVQWTGIPPNTVDSDIGHEIMNLFGMTKPPIDVLMKSLPIVDGDTKTWKDLKSINLRAGISEDATDVQRGTIENNLMFMSKEAANISVLEEDLAKGPEWLTKSQADLKKFKKQEAEGTFEGRPQDIEALERHIEEQKEKFDFKKWEDDLKDKIAARKVKFEGYKAVVDELNVDLPELVESDVQDTATDVQDTATDVPVVKTITSGADEDLSGMHITEEKDLKKVAAEVVKEVTNGAVPEVQKVGLMEKEWVKEYIANLQKMANPFGDPNDAPLFDDVDEIEDYRDIKLLENEELKMKINRKDPNRLDKLLKAMGIDSQAATFGNLEMTGPKKVLGGKNGFGTFAEKDEQIPIAQMKASVNAYMEEKYTPEELANVNKPGGMSLSQYNYEKKLAAIKIRAGEVLLVPNTSTNQLNGVTATSNQMEMEKASGTGAFTSIKQGDKIVNSSNTYTQSRIGSTNEEWTQKAALANALRFSGLSFPTN